MLENNRWVCSQIGAREYYMIPRALVRLSLLSAFYSDLWFNSRFKLLFSFLGTPGKKLKSRMEEELDNYAFSIGNFKNIFSNNRWVKNKDLYKFYCTYGSYFAQEVNKKIDSIGFDTYFTYNTSALETFKLLKNSKNLVLGQIDPGIIERDIVLEECKKFPDYLTNNFQSAPDSYFERIDEEWQLADMIIVNSEWSKQCLIDQGVPISKLEVLPLCYEAKISSPPKLLNRGLLRVLFLGSVIVRKGIQYLIEAARKLEKENIEILVVGSIGISRKIIENAPKNMIFTGNIARIDIPMVYLKSDVFVLPTVSDGFAITQIEAMSFGLPVITTSRCGDVIIDGEDGILIHPFNADEIVKAIMRYYFDREFLRTSSANAIKNAKKFDFNNLQRRLLLINSKIN